MLRRRPSTPLLILLALLLFLGPLGGTGWYYSEKVYNGALAVTSSKPSFDLEVVSAQNDRVTLRPAPAEHPSADWERDGTWGLVWEQGYGQMGSIIEVIGQQVTRNFRLMQAEPSAGTRTRVDAGAWPENPQTAYGFSFTEVSTTSRLGSFPAWFLPGAKNTWMIFVHGKGSSRRESLRILPVFVQAGYPTLVVTYRNDDGTPPSPESSYRFGQTEWEDLEGAVRYAEAQGARSLVLVGYSMGGAIVTNFLYRSPLSQRVRGVILDAPALDFEGVINYAARRQSLPEVVTWLGKTVSAWRFNIDWERWNLLHRAAELRVPILLFHGAADDVVPIQTSDALAAARPDLVTYAQFEGARHTRSWNIDPGFYQQRVKDFLDKLGP